MLDFRIGAVLIMAMLSILVTFFNFRVIYRLRNEKEAFYTICINKSIANILIAAAFQIWSIPCSILNEYYLPLEFNIIFGIIVGWAPYIMSGPFTQLCFSINRAIAVFLPFKYNIQRKYPTTKIVLIILWALASGLSIPSMTNGCSYIFYPDSISWGPMDSPCSLKMSDIFTKCVLIFAITSILINTLNILKVYKSSKITGIWSTVSATQKRKRTKMFIQCSIQDCSHTLDCIFNTYIYTLSEYFWFQFYCGTISVLLTICFDGIIMTLLHQKSKPTDLRHIPVSHFPNRRISSHPTVNL